MNRHHAAQAMKASLQTKLNQLSLRQTELNALLSAEDATRDLERYRALIARARGDRTGRRSAIASTPQ